MTKQPINKVTVNEDDDELQFYVGLDLAHVHTIKNAIVMGADGFIEAAEAFVAERAPTLKMVKAWCKANVIVKEHGTIVKDKYKKLYGREQNCGDEMAAVLTNWVSMPIKVEGKKDVAHANVDTMLEVAQENDVLDNFNIWAKNGLNPGQIRMNLGNMLRGRLAKGLQVTIGKKTWKANEKTQAEYASRRKKGKGESANTPARNAA